MTRQVGATLGGAASRNGPFDRARRPTLRWRLALCAAALGAHAACRPEIVDDGTGHLRVVDQPAQYTPSTPGVRDVGNDVYDATRGSMDAAVAAAQAFCHDFNGVARILSVEQSNTQTRNASEWHAQFTCTGAASP